MRPDPRAVFRAWASFRGSGLGTQAFLGARLAIVPLGALDAELRALSGRVLSLGSGHGIVERYLAEINPDARVEGLELDEERVTAAARTGARSPRVVIRHADVTKMDDEAGTFDAALAVDVFHHIRPDAHAEVAAALARSVRPGGAVIVKDMDLLPRWKHRWNAFHDRMVAHEQVHCRTPEDMASLFEAAGLVASTVRHVDRRLSPYPQYLVSLRKPETAVT
jgi:SAM-dependent methyltransferase